MSDRRYFDWISLLGLAIAAAAICDMLAVWNFGWLESAYTIYALGIFLSVCVVIFSKKATAYFVDVCKNKTYLLGLRLVLAAGLFLLGWYVNAAMGSLYGKESLEVAYNSARFLALTATLVGHVFYFGFTKKARKS